MLDNIEVLFSASVNGRNFFAYGANLFSEFTVSDYLSYRRALCSKKAEESEVRSLINPNKKIGSLCAAEMRIVQFFEKTAGSPDKPVVINLDGARHTRKNIAALERLIKYIQSDVYVCATDRRFIGCLPADHKTLAFGRADFIRPRFYRANKLRKRIGANRVSVM